MRFRLLVWVKNLKKQIMFPLLSNLYDRLPVVREVRRLDHRVTGLLTPLAGAGIIEAIEAVKAGHERYRDPRRLLAHGAQYWSQNYEDGMIAEIFRRIGVQAKTFLEIGAGNGWENNTAALVALGWSGWWIEGDQTLCDHIGAKLRETPATAARLKVRQAFVAPEKITALLAELGVPAEVDLFSLDIDLDTYHVWAALKQFKPRVVVVEYNPAFPPDQAWIHPYQPGRSWNGTQLYGASLKAYERLGAEFGYSLVGCDLIGVNAFFVRNDLVADKFVAPFTAENHYEPARYQLVARTGHPSGLPFVE
jgi:hypothetical protein